MQTNRVATVTAWLVVAGAVFGTVAGVLTLGVWLVASGGLNSFGDALFVIWAGLWFGGGLGALLGPVAAWVLMRHVPLWLAVGGTTAGTLAGGGMGLIATGDPMVAMTYGIGGFALTAVGLRVAVPRRERRLPGTEPACADALAG